MPIGSWRLVGRRSLADRLVVAVAWLVMVAAVTLLAAGAMYADAVARSGLLRSLGQPGAIDSSVFATALVPPAEADSADATVTREVSAALGDALGELSRFGRSESFALPGQGEAVRDLAVFAFAEGIEGRARLVDGAWPAAGGEPMATVVSEAVNQRLGLAVGDVLEVTSRLDGRSVEVRVAGVFAITDPADAYWGGESLVLSGVSEGASFTTHGPLFVPRQDLLSRTVVHRAELRWRATPVLERIAAGNTDSLRARLSGLGRRLEAELETASSLRVETELPQLLSAAGSSLLVSRAGVLLLNIQLAVLAGYALLLVGALIVDQRRAETALLRSRGASTLQIFGFGLMEALLLVLPAAVAAPLLAMGVVELLEAAGPLAGSGLALQPQVTQDALLLGGLACLVSLLALALPGLASAGPLSGIRRAVGRQLQRTLPQRLGLDIALLALAVIGLWQLQQYGAPLTRGMRGALGIDPLLIAAPTLGLLAGAILALRILPLLARALENVFGRGQGMGTALGARQLARRPLRYTRSALLLMVASSIGIFAATYGATWAQSQRDQVDYAVGADARATSRSAQAPAWATAAAYTELGGVSAAVPVVREGLQLGRAGGRGMLLVLPPEAAGGSIHLRPDLADGGVDGAMTALAAARGEVDALPLPDGTAALAATVELRITATGSQGAETPLPAGWGGATLTAVVRDDNGLVHRFPGENRAGPGTTEVVVPLTSRAAGVSERTPIGRLELVGLEVGVLPVPTAILTGELRLGGLRAASHRGADVWSPVDTAALADRWQPLALDALGLATPLPATSQLPAGIRFDDAQPLTGTSEARYVIRPPELPGTSRMPVPALVNAAFMDATGTIVGDQIAVGEQFGASRRAVVAGVLSGFPTLDPEAPLAVLDLRSTALADWAEQGRLLSPLEWWLELAHETDTLRLSEALATPPFGASEVRVRAAELSARTSDPIALGIVGALVLGSAAAWFFAALGFVVSAAVATRERLSEFALLQALGLSGRQLATSLSLENAFLLLISLGVGVGLGAVLAWVVLPSVTLTPQGTPPLPQVQVAMPWDVLLLLAVLGAVLLVVTLYILRRMSSDDSLGGQLRLREE